jgi:hypothetical protein
VKHLYGPVPPKKKGKFFRRIIARTRCGLEYIGDADELVEVALESDCDNCRVAIGIARASDNAYGRGGEIGVRSPPVFTPEPHRDIESMEEIRKRRDGL